MGFTVIYILSIHNNFNIGTFSTWFQILIFDKYNQTGVNENWLNQCVDSFRLCVSGQFSNLSGFNTDVDVTHDLLDRIRKNKLK